MLVLLNIQHSILLFTKITSNFEMQYLLNNNNNNNIKEYYSRSYVVP
jgi:hypothetical protein